MTTNSSDAASGRQTLQLVPQAGYGEVEIRAELAQAYENGLMVAERVAKLVIARTNDEELRFLSVELLEIIKLTRRLQRLLAVEIAG